MVFPLHRSGHRRVDRLYGSREHRRCQPAAALDHRWAVRARAWFRLRRHPQGATAVRRLEFAGIATLVQHRDRDWPARHFVRLRSGARSVVPRCDVGADGDHRGVCDRCPYRLALDDRPRRRAVEDAVAATHRTWADDPGTMGGRRGPRGWSGEVAREMDRTQMAGPCPAGRESDRRVTASNIGAHRAKTDSEREMSFFGGHDVSVTREPSGLELVVSPSSCPIRRRSLATLL